MMYLLVSSFIMRYFKKKKKNNGSCCSWNMLSFLAILGSSLNVMTFQGAVLSFFNLFFFPYIQKTLRWFHVVCETFKLT